MYIYTFIIISLSWLLPTHTNIHKDKRKEIQEEKKGKTKEEKSIQPPNNIISFFSLPYYITNRCLFITIGVSAKLHNEWGDDAEGVPYWFTVRGTVVKFNALLSSLCGVS